MKLVLDTNIWYEVETNEIFKNKSLKNIIISNYLNYFELIKKPKIVAEPDAFRQIFFKMDEYDKIFEPPFIHIAKLHKFFNYDILIEQYNYIMFLVNFKNGDFIDPSKSDKFKEYINSINLDFENLSKVYNEEAKRIKSKITNNKTHLKLDTSQLTNEFIISITNQATGINIEKFDFNKIELLSKTLHTFFKKMEVGELIMKTNDIIDFFMLSYVQPGDLYYTKDIKWLKLIKDAGCEKYLYK